MPDVGMPRLSDSMREGAVSQWLVEDGAEVTRGQEILEVETDKATMTYEAEHDGPLRILVPEGVSVEVGQLIAIIGEPDRPSTEPTEPAEPAEQFEPAMLTAPPSPEAAAVQQLPVSTPSTPSMSREGRRSDLSPLLRRLAREHGVDIEMLKGSGSGGKVVRSDITDAAASLAPEPPSPPALSSGPRVAETAGRRVPLSRSQRLVAGRMSESKRTIPDFWVSLAADVTRLLALRDDLKAAPAGSRGSESVPTVNDLIVKACALALVEHPRLNAAYDEDHLVSAGEVNVGIAVSTDNGLLVPVVRSADRQSLAEIAATSQRLTAQARAGKIAAADLAGGTFTVSNLGGFGVRAFAPIVNGRQAAILGVGAATPTCVPTDGAVAVRSMLELTLTCDHRIVYGADAARFLQTLKGLLESPAVLL
jgi:pyruvate dehydrogenase E2 component (dihydrolipoyllysine-residue acetyltransferase)